MKKWLILLPFLILFTPVRILAQTTHPLDNMTGQEIVDQSVDRFYRDCNIMWQRYKSTVTEKETTVFQRTQHIFSGEKLYEYVHIKGILMRKQLADENGPLAKEDKFHPPPKPLIEVNREFFRRFSYRIKSHNRGTIILEFVPRENLEAKRVLDPAANQLVGELEVREKDLAFMRFSAHLPDSLVVKIKFEHAYSIKIDYTNQDFDGLVLPKSFTLKADFTIIRLRQQLTQTKETSYQKLVVKENLGSLPGYDYTMDPEPGSQSSYFWIFWREANMTRWLLIGFGVTIAVIVYKKWRKRKKVVGMELLKFKSSSDTEPAFVNKRPY